MARPGRHVLFTVPGLSIANVMPDLMHCKHLGSDQYLYGAVLQLLTHRILPGSRAENIAAVWAELQALYSELGIQSRLVGITVVIAMLAIVSKSSRGCGGNAVGCVFREQI